MRVELNGTAVDTSARTLTELLAERGIAAEAVATALNGTFVPRAARPRTPLAEGVRIEVVAPMQGG